MNDIQKESIDSFYSTPQRVTIDLLDYCNLKCPSCYHGIHGGTSAKLNLSNAKNIMDHISSYFDVSDLFCYNWSEPLLSKELPEFAILFSQYPKLRTNYSSNMNARISKKLPEQILPYMDIFKFSVSGFQQSIYSKYHRGGNIKQVRKNIDLFLQAREKNHAKTKFALIFGINRYNKGEEEIIHNYCDNNNIIFQPARYYLTDVQDVHLILSGESISKERYELFYESEQDLRNDIISRLTPSKCKLLKSDIVLDCDGNIMTCCATKISTKIPITEIKNSDDLAAVRLNNEFCQKCYKSGISGYVTR